jgi:hypothetical protein
VFDGGNKANLFDEDLGFLFENVDHSFNNIVEDEVGQFSRFETFYDPIFDSNFSDNALIPLSGTSSSRATNTLNLQSHRPPPMVASQSRRPKETSRFNSIPRNGKLNDLPFLLDNVNTPTEQRLFFHFTTLTSRVLTLSSGKNNPLTSIVVPLAAKDQTVMHSLLCLAGSHLVSISKDRNTQDINFEKDRLHALATRTQALRVQTLEQSGCPHSAQEIEAVLTGALLLCLYEICEGSGDATWRLHLETARTLISWTVSQSNRDDTENDSTIIEPLKLSKVNRFLLEFFIYHDTLAAVTVTSCSPILPSQMYREFSEIQEAYVVGVNDGLCDLITRIAELRSRLVTAPGVPDGGLLCEAVVIWDDLAQWEPKSTDAEQRLIGSLYQWALFIWLYCIVHPDGIADEKLQSAVKSAIGDLEQVDTASGVLSCLLFPLFIIGTASIEEADRTMVKTHFQNLKAWSGLGNIKVAQQIVERSWTGHDDKIPRSWDWMAQMEMSGISVPVT